MGLLVVVTSEALAAGNVS